ncbi:MAG: cadherin repeat domain-containing protein [Betaproteobacteria bacterium]|nr:cadherin repeat domain-containing protein [Betaproteobacteria bacterium]
MHKVVTQALTISVSNVNEAPSISSASAGTVAENAPPSTVVYQAQASDPDAGDTLIYSLTGTDAALFEIDAQGALRLKASANYEAKNNYTLNVVATDAGGLVSTQKMRPRARWCIKRR